MAYTGKPTPLDPLGTNKPAPKPKPKKTQPASAPPAPPPPPKPTPKKGAQTQQAAYDAILKKYPAYRPYAALVAQAAARWGIDPVYLLATLAWENGGAKAGITNSAGAVGLAQIVDRKVNPGLNQQQYKSFIAQYGDFSYERAKDPVWSINYMAWRMTGHIRQYGTLNDAYDKGYNPGFTGDSRGKGPEALIPGFYQTKAKIPPSPQDAAGKQIDNSGATQQLTDPWAVITPKGQLKYVNSATPPAGAVKYAGTPLTRSQFLQMWQTHLNPIFESYTGKEATAKDAAMILGKGWSDYHLQTQLAQSPAFYKSPIWKSAAPSYVAAWRSVYGNQKVDRSVVQYAIVHNVNGDGFHELLRARKDYVASNEFKQNAGSLKSVYESVYGLSDANASNAIKQATLAGWTTDQFAAYLRHLPQYQQSNEYHQRALTFLDSLGLVTGAVSTMVPDAGQNDPTQQKATPTKGYAPGGRVYPTGETPPYDPRVPVAQAPKPKGPGAGMVPV